MSRRAVLWTLFVLVHAFVAWLGFALPNEPMGDVYRVYEPWSTQALEGRGIVGITEAWVYPQLALVPMVLAHAFAWIAGYTIGWALLVATLLFLAMLPMFLGLLLILPLLGHATWHLYRRAVTPSGLG